MKVTLINYTPNALETLIFTKSTRLRMSGRGLQEIIDWPMDKKMEEWRYMQGTIKSSWEFADYIFMIEDVTRAFTHQLVRHRVGTSFAQQAQRVVNMTDFGFVATGTIRDAGPGSTLMLKFEEVMELINLGYQDLIQLGANPQDARGVLPTNIETNICFKANLRTLNGMSGERLCVKAQGEMQDVMRQIRTQVITVHPWAEPALRVACAQHGVCAFPTYSWKEEEKGCPIKGGVFNPETALRWDESQDPYRDHQYYNKPLTKDQIQELWETRRAEAQPVAPKEDQ